MRLRQVLRACLLALFATGSAAAFAHDGHAHKIVGTLTMVAADYVMVRTRAGKEVTVRIAEKTKVTQGRQALKIEALKAGTRVVITASGAKEPYTATVIQAGATPKTASSAKRHLQR